MSKRILLYLPLTILTIIPYTIAYGISHFFKLENTEDMETPKEYITMWCNPDYE